jgi:hypothetical protein
MKPEDVTDEMLDAAQAVADQASLFGDPWAAKRAVLAAAINAMPQTDAQAQIDAARRIAELEAQVENQIESVRFHRQRVDDLAAAYSKLEAERDRWIALYRRAVNEANGLTNTNETESDGASYRDPRDNCPTEGAVLKREWREKAATISMLTKMVDQQGKAFREHHDALLALYVALRDSAPNLSPFAAQAFRKTRETLARYGK